MKVVVFALISILLFCHHQVQADLLGVTFNADFAKLSLAGRGGDHQWSQPLQFSDNNWQNWSVAFEHPVPLVPNMMLRRQTASWNGTTQLEGNLQLATQLFARQSQVDNMLDLKSTDVSFYYEVLDNNLLALDIGMTAMDYDAQVAVFEPISTSRSASGLLPLLYNNLTVYVWGTDTALFWQGNYTDFRRQHWSQTKVGLSREFVDLKALTVALKIGWQQQSVKLTDKDQLDADFQIKGPFLALEADF